MKNPYISQVLSIKEEVKKQLPCGLETTAVLLLEFMSKSNSIIYAVIRPEISEQVSVGLIFVDDDRVEMRYSSEKLKALQGLFPEESYSFISKVVRSMGRKHSEYRATTIDYLTRYSNNLVSISPLQSIDIMPTEQIKEKLYRNYVYGGDNS